MHVLAVLLVAIVVHVAIVRWRLPLPALLAGAVVALGLVALVVRPTNVLESVAGGVIVLAALTTAMPLRQVRLVADGVRDVEWQPSSIPGDGDRLVRTLEEHGFEVAGDGWALAPALGWAFVALRQGPVRVFVVSGERGPSLDVRTALDNGCVLVTAPSARLRVPPHLVRQTVPSSDALEVIAEHERTLVAVVEAGRTPEIEPLGELTGRALADEVEHCRHVLAGGPPAAAVSLWRDLTGNEADLGPVTGRPDDFARLTAAPT